MEISELKKIFSEQQDSFKKIVCEDTFEIGDLKYTAGVDLAYRTDKNNDEMAVCCIVIIDNATHCIVEKSSVTEK